MAPQMDGLKFLTVESGVAIFPNGSSKPLPVNVGEGLSSSPASSRARPASVWLKPRRRWIITSRRNSRRRV
jgi:hypothetical protein